MTIKIQSGVNIGPGITITTATVTNNLLLSLDAANYTGSGTAWPAEPGTNGTLVATPVYTSVNPTYFSFVPASFQYATDVAMASMTNWTIEAWFRTTATLTGQITAVVCDQFDGSTNLNFSMGTNNSPASYNLSIGFFNGAWRTTTGFAPTLNTWTYCAGTYNGTTLVQYQNGTSQSTTSYTGISASGGQGIRLARRWDSPANVSANFFPGDIAIVRIYNTALSAGQILQNYNAESARFGL